jgi:lysophospholipase II
MSFRNYRKQISSSSSSSAAVFCGLLVFVSVLLMIPQQSSLLLSFVRSMSTTTTSTTVKIMSSSSASTITRGVVIFLHGLGDGTPVNGWEMSLKDQLVQYKSSLSSDSIQYVFPKSPIIPISINGGTTMPGWFDLYDWPIDQYVQDDTTTIRSSVQSINDIIQQCCTTYNLSSTKQIIIGGFSQGAAIALLTAYHPIYGYSATTATAASSSDDTSKTDENRSAVLGGCISLSGWLPFRQQTNDWVNHDNEVKQLQQQIPLFWGHGTYDDKVLYEHQQIGIDHLIQNHCAKHVTSKNYPVGHSSHPNEMKALAEFIDNIFFPKEDAMTNSKTDNRDNNEEL